jgi:hypothetical protein
MYSGRTNWDLALPTNENYIRENEKFRVIEICDGGDTLFICEFKFLGRWHDSKSFYDEDEAIQWFEDQLKYTEDD